MDKKEELEVIDTCIDVLTTEETSIVNSNRVESLLKDCQSTLKDIAETHASLESSLVVISSTTENKKAEILTKRSTLEVAVNSKQSEIQEYQITYDNLVEQCKHAEEQTKGLREKLPRLHNEALLKIPKDKFICSLMKNITNIEWDVQACNENASLVKGAIVTEQNIKTFAYDKQSDEPEAVTDKIWDMMEEAEHFSKTM